MAATEATKKRRFNFEMRALPVQDGETQEELWVEGYALRFESPTVLFEFGGTEYKEQIMRGALNECRMDDVIFNYNHGGKVMARTRNNTLELKVDDNGLFIRARLDGTAEGQEMYRNIRDGYVDRMSFAFQIREESYDSENHQWNIRAIKRIYDVSAVDIPAYDDTSIEARKEELESKRQNETEKRNAEALEKEKLKLKIKLNA